MRFLRKIGVISCFARDPKLPGSNADLTIDEEEIDGLIKVHKDGHVERFPIVPDVPSTSTPELDVLSKDVIVNKFTGVWARFYVPRRKDKLPVMVYFHGGGFCVGSASWKCYHLFLSKLSSNANCVIMSVNYRLSPENRLPAAFEDGFDAVHWLKKQMGFVENEQTWWCNHSDFSKVFLAGDSAGGCIAYNVAVRLGNSESCSVLPLCIKGIILIQPFFGGEKRTDSEKNTSLPSNSVLPLAIADIYWRLALPLGSNRDHQWSNPMNKGSIRMERPKIPSALICIAELDILKDRNIDFCRYLKKTGKTVEQMVSMGVGHAFHILHHSKVAQLRTQEMISHLRNFINGSSL